MWDAKMNQALRDCLDSCYASEAPLVALANFGKELSSNPNWTDNDIGEVTLRAFRLLSRISKIDDGHKCLESPPFKE
jgi:hypothetical protein